MLLWGEFLCGKRVDGGGVSDRAPKDQIRIIGAKVKETKVGTMVTITVRVIMSEMETTTATTTSTWVTKMIGTGPMSLLKIVKLLLRMVEIVWRGLRICCTK